MSGDRKGATVSESRHPAGTSVGGQWAPSAAGEIDDMLDETFDSPETESPTEFRDSGSDVGRVEPGEVVRIDEGRAYVLGGSRGLVAATKTGDGYSMREYVYAEQATPDNYSNPDIDMLESTRPEGMNINLSHDPDTPGYSRAHKFAPALYDSEVSPDPEAALRKYASPYIGTTNPDQTEAEVFESTGTGPGRIPETQAKAAANEWMADNPEAHPVPANGAVPGWEGELSSLHPKGTERVFAHKSAGSQVSFYSCDAEGKISVRRTR